MSKSPEQLPNCLKKAEEGNELIEVFINLFSNPFNYVYYIILKLILLYNIIY